MSKVSYDDERENGGSAVGRNALADSECFQRVLNDGIDALPCGFALFDANDRVVLTNKTFREMLPSGAALLDAGASFPEMARHNAMAFFGIDEDAIEEWLERRLAYRESPEGTFDQQLKDGRWYRIQECRTSDGGTVTNWTDITDLKMQEQVAENYSDALFAKNQQLEEFAHVASHDLQEPLREIEVFADRLTTKCADQLDDRARQYLDRVTDATGRMRRLIKDLLDFSRIDNHRDSFESVDLNDVLADVQSTLDLRVQESGTTLTSEALPTVIGDFGQLSRLFQNLISNAMKYVAEDTIPTIAITSRSPDPAHVEIAFKDNGIGFAQSDAEKIFQIFQRLHGRGSKYDGTGIGLASCRKIVDQHGGGLRAESEPGKGSTFFVTLPINGEISIP